MSNEFSAAVDLRGNQLFVHLKGPIDEDTQFPALQLEGVAAIFIDLDGVKVINSIGIRMWIEWTSKINKVVPITFSRVRKAIVMQFNMVHNFFPPGASVRSIYVPMYCEKCDLSQDLLLENPPESKFSKYDFASIELKKKICAPAQADDTGIVAEFCEIEPDIVLDKYFAFSG